MLPALLMRLSVDVERKKAPPFSFNPWHVTSLFLHNEWTRCHFNRGQKENEAIHLPLGHEKI